MDILEKRSFVTLSLIIGFYLFWELRALDLPAAQSEEARQACIALRIIKNLPPHACTSYDSKIFGRWIPILLDPYHGTGEAYLLTPFILLGGFNFLSIRIFSLTSGLISLLLLYRFCKEFLNIGSALIVVFLLVIDWTFIEGTKLGFNYGATMDVFLVGSLLCLYRWYQSKKRPYIFIGSFLVGFGLLIKSWFLWYIIALTVISLISLKEIRKKFSIKELSFALGIGLLGFCIAIAPFVYHEIETGLGLMRYIIRFSMDDSGQCNNAQYLLHLNDRIRNLRELPTFVVENMIGQVSEGTTWAHNESFKYMRGRLSSLYFYLFIACLVWHITMVISHRGKFQWHRKIVLLLFIVMFLQTPFSVLHLSYPHLTSDHILLFLPLVKMLIGMGLYEMMWLSNKIKKALLLFLFLLFVLHIAGLSHYYAILKNTGGMGMEFEALKQVTDYLMAKDIRNILLLDQKLWHFIPLFTGGMINETYFDLTREESIPKIESEINKRGTFCIFRAPEFADLNFFDDFIQLAEKKKQQIREVERFYQRDGRLIFVLYSVD